MGEYADIAEGLHGIAGGLHQDFAEILRIEKVTHAAEPAQSYAGGAASRLCRQGVVRRRERGREAHVALDIERGGRSNAGPKEPRQPHTRHAQRLVRETQRLEIVGVADGNFGRLPHHALFGVGVRVALGEQSRGDFRNQALGVGDAEIDLVEADDATQGLRVSVDRAHAPVHHARLNNVFDPRRVTAPGGVVDLE